MNFLPDLTLVFDSLGWAVLHSLWQGALAAVAVWAFRHFTKESAADLRYMFSFATLTALLAAFMATFIFYYSSGSVTGETIVTLWGLNTVGAGSNAASTAASPLTLLLNSANLIGTVWAVCFAVLAAKYLAAFRLTHKLRQTGLSPLPNHWQHKFEELVLASGANKRTQAFISEHVSSPITFGFFKPIVLVPAWFFGGMDSEQCEAVLLHELAHIRRHDYVANILQIAIKTVFFYHPAIQFISKTIDADREDACDDFAVQMTRDPESLARALGTIRLRAARGGGVFALSADGPEAPLMHRLKRLMGTPNKKGQTGAVRGFASTAMLAISCGLVLVLGATQSQAHPQSEANGEATAEHWDETQGQELAGAAPQYSKKASYNYGHFVKDGKSYKIKTAANGKSWVKVDGSWHDVESRPDLNITPPQIPVPPVVLNSPYGSDTVAVPAPPAPNTFVWSAEPDEAVLAELAQEWAEEHAEIAQEWAEEQVEFQQEMAELRSEHAADIAEAQREMAEAQADMHNWSDEDKREWEREQAEFQREMADLSRELAHEQQNLQRQLDQEQRSMEREMAMLERELEQDKREHQREIAQEQRELAMEQRELAREQREHARQEANIEREKARAEADHIRAERNKKYEDMRERLIPELIADGYMTSADSEVTLKVTANDIYVNGQKVSDAQEGRYCEIISDYIDRKGDVKKIAFKPGFMQVEIKGNGHHSSYTHTD